MGQPADRGGICHDGQDDAQRHAQTMIGRRHALGMLAATAALAGCGGGGGSGSRSRPTGARTAEIYRQLAATGARFERTASAGQGQCVIPAPIRLRSLPVAAMTPPVLTSAHVALPLARFDVQVIQPLAVKWLGARVRSIGHYGSYACRSMRGNGGRLSLHATGQAIDIASFALTNGRVIGVEYAWRTARGPSAASSRTWPTTLAAISASRSPETDDAHVDHLHLDVGRWAACSI